MCGVRFAVGDADAGLAERLDKEISAFNAASRAGMIAQTIAGDPPPISTIRPMTPVSLDRVVGTCLAKNPDDRFQTAHDVMLELRFIAEGSSAAGVPAPVARRRAWRERAAWVIAAARRCREAAL